MTTLLLVCDVTSRYVLATVELLAQGNFSVIIFAGSRSQQPANALLRRWHEHIDYRLKKNVEAFYIVNSTFYFRTVAKLFIRLDGTYLLSM